MVRAELDVGAAGLVLVELHRVDRAGVDEQRREQVRLDLVAVAGGRFAPLLDNGCGRRDVHDDLDIRAFSRAGLGPAHLVFPFFDDHSDRPRLALAVGAEEEDRLALDDPAIIERPGVDADDVPLLLIDGGPPRARLARIELAPVALAGRDELERDLLGVAGSAVGRRSVDAVEHRLRGEGCEIIFLSQRGQERLASLQAGLAFLGERERIAEFRCREGGFVGRDGRVEGFLGGIELEDSELARGGLDDRVSGADLAAIDAIQGAVEAVRRAIADF